MTKSPSPLREAAIKILDPHAKPAKLTTPRCFITLCSGDHLAALFFSQCLYWSDRTQDRDGWFSKSFKEWDDELGMSTFQVRRAVNALKIYGLEVKKRRSQHHSGAPTLHYRLNITLMMQGLKAFAARALERSSLKEATHKSHQAVAGKTYTETTAKKKEKDSPAETTAFKTTAVLSPDGEAHVIDASQSEKEQGRNALSVKAHDSFTTRSLHDREESLPGPSAEEGLAALVLTSPPSPLHGERGAEQVESLSISLIWINEEQSFSLIANDNGVTDDDLGVLIADDTENQNALIDEHHSTAAVGTGPALSTTTQSSTRTRQASSLRSDVEDLRAGRETPPPGTARPVIDVPRGGAGTKSDLSSSATDSHKAHAKEPHLPFQAGAMLAAVAFAFKIPQGAYAGKIGQFFKGSMPRKRKDLWAHYQPEQAATPQEVIALYLWYSRHASYVKSCLEHGGRLPATPSILRDRLDEFRDATGYAQAMQAAMPLLEKLLRGETIAAPVPTSPKATPPTGPIESAGAYKNYDPKHDPAYQRAVDSDAAAAAFAQVFGR